MKRKKRVVLGMSGGVDSSVAAALLKKRGYDVIGITMQLLPKESEKRSACCNIDSISDAKRVANKLNIPHYTINIRDSFKENVIDLFVKDYMMGLTPNPCVECNRTIKFDELKKVAKDLKADYVATGHYCKITKHPHKSKFYLKKAKDLRKDQSYFLYMLDEEQLKETMFPLGGFTKPEIREMAHKFNLINADKAESQEICFVTKGKYHEFIEQQVEKKQLKPGPIYSHEGKVMGEHKGIHHYTIGQKRGLNLLVPYPMYVYKIDAQNNSIYVGFKEHLVSSIFTLNNCAWVRPNENLEGKTFDIKCRYQMVPFKAKILSHVKNTIKLEALSPQECITPGQSGVLYKGDFVIGGGTISVS
jgi:tRNA-uridine 2-sulfurtransferase